MTSVLCYLGTLLIDGVMDMLEVVWKSVTNHIQDIHEGHLTSMTSMGPLDETGRDEEWLRP